MNNTTSTLTAEERIAARIAAHLDAFGDAIETLDDLDLGSIATCIAIIGAGEPGQPGHDAGLVQLAAESVASWMSDYGVNFVAAARSIGAIR